MKRRSFRHTVNRLWNVLVISSTYFFITYPVSTYASFEKIKSGIVTLTADYLVPLTIAIAGGKLVYYIIMLLNDKEEYRDKIVNVFPLVVLAVTGSGLVTIVADSFR